MKGKYLVSCSIAAIMILLLADVIDSRGSSRSSSSSRSRSRSGSSRSHSSHSISHSSSSGSHSSSTREGSHSTSSKSVGSSGRSVHKSTHPKQNAFPSKHHSDGPQNHGYSSLHPKDGRRSSWDQSNGRSWTPKSSQPKLKYVAGAAAAGVAAGAVGGFLVGRGMSRMNFHFKYPEEERWWHENRNLYPDRVYFPKYNEQPVPEEVFVRDCVNVTVREFTEPNGNQTTNDTEIRVVTQVVHQMCTQEYRGSFLRQAGGGNFGRKSEMKNTAGGVITYLEGRPNNGHGMAVTLHVSFLMMPFFLISLY